MTSIVVLVLSVVVLLVVVGVACTMESNNTRQPWQLSPTHFEAAAKIMSQRMQTIDEQLAPNSQRVTLARKPTSNVFRDQQNDVRKEQSTQLAIHPWLSGIYALDVDKRTVSVGGMTRFDTLVDATLAHGFVPLVTPELVSITVGGAISGVAVESSSWKYGLVHNTVTDMTVLLADGSVRTTRRGEQLFNAIPNSYGTLGYVLRATVGLMPATPHVLVQRVDVNNDTNFEAVFAAINEHCVSRQWLFVEAVIFSKTRACLLLAKFSLLRPQEVTTVDPRTDVFHKILRSGPEHFYMRTRDYLFRWDPDGFFTTPEFLHNRLVRAVCRPLLRSDRLREIGKTLDSVTSLFSSKSAPATHESIVQDLGVSLTSGAPFVRWIDTHLVDLYPIWLCPFATRVNDASLLWRMPRHPENSDDGDDRNPLGLAVDVGIGFGVQKKLDANQQPGHYTRQVERELARLGGVKGLYSQSYYEPDEFWTSIIDGKTYGTLKRTFDPNNRFPTVYEKCVVAPKG